VAKEENLKCRIGFFMHIPFPPWDMVKIHPWKDFFLQGHHRLNMELDLHGLFGLLVYSCTLG
jgi:trehalose-6-phosphate synthase